MGKGGMVAVVSVVAVAAAALWFASQREANHGGVVDASGAAVRAMERLGEVFVEKTGGAHRFARTHRTDRTEAFLVQEVRLGKVGMAAVDIATFHDLVPETRALSLPYLFSSDDQVARALNGPVGGRILGQIARLGLVAMAAHDAAQPDLA